MLHVIHRRFETSIEVPFYLGRQKLGDSVLLKKTDHLWPDNDRSRDSNLHIQMII